MKAIARWAVYLGMTGLVSCAGVPKPPPPWSDMTPEQRVAAWEQMLTEQRQQPLMRKLQLVNDFINQLQFLDDSLHWGREDYWATPLESLRSNGGDCEDFTVAKYFSLKRMGVPADRLRLTYVKSLTLNQAHMVLSYYPDASSEPLVLDNLVRSIQPASQRSDLVPVYGFNAEGVWLARQRYGAPPAGPAEQVGLWRELQRRVAAEMKDVPATETKSSSSWF